jgi:hypothetical protein
LAWFSVELDDGGAASLRARRWQQRRRKRHLRRVCVLAYLFQGGPAPPCLDSADVNDDGELDLSDAVYLVGFPFAGGSPPPAPHPECGADLPDDDLTCGKPAGCP